MTEPFVSSATWVGAYWGPRQESVDTCAERLARCLTMLGSAHQVLSTWFRKGQRKAAARQPVLNDREALRDLLLAGRSHRDSDGEVMESLGFSVGLWNRNKPAVGLRAAVGGYDSAPGLMNSLVLQIPPASGDGQVLYEPPVARHIMTAVVESWDPDHASWASMSLQNSQGPKPGDPVIGWLTYMAARSPEAAGRAASAGGQPFWHGYLIVLAERPDMVTLKAAERTREALAEADG